jgi:hypothetical protein
MFADVIGHISWQEVRKLVITSVCPLSESRVKLLPLWSIKGRFNTSAGIGSFKYVPPPDAASPVPVFGVATGCPRLLASSTFALPHEVRSDSAIRTIPKFEVNFRIFEGYQSN